MFRNALGTFWNEEVHQENLSLFSFFLYSLQEQQIIKKNVQGKHIWDFAIAGYSVLL